MHELSQGEEPEGRAIAHGAKMGIYHQGNKDPENPEEVEER